MVRPRIRTTVRLASSVALALSISAGIAWAATPDLSLTKSDGGASVAPGGTVAYTLTYANTGTVGAAGVVLTETVPANTAFNAGASTAGWFCTPNNNAGSTCTLSVGNVAAGDGNHTATFAVTVSNPLPGGVSQIVNTATVTDNGASGADPTPGNNSASDTTPVTGAPDLSLTKSDGGVSVAPGGSVAYTLTYANIGNRGASGVVLTETVPANSTFNAGASTAGWLCAPNNNAGSTCTLAIGNLAGGGGNHTATFAVTVPNPAPVGATQIANTATLADDGANGTDPTPGNNSGSDTTPVSGAPDLSLTKSDGGASVAPGGSVAYTLTYANSGNHNASGVVLTETVPANSTFNPGASTAGWFCAPNDNAGSTCTLAVGNVAAGGGNQTATFTVTAANPLPGGVAQIANTASISDDGTNGIDPTPGNNTGSDTTPRTTPDLSLTKSDGGASVTPGGTVAYTLTYANTGTAGATGVVLTETVPANTAFNAGASTAGWVCSPNGNAGSTCTLAVGGVAAGSGNQTAIFAITVTSPLPGGVNQIANTASIADDGANGPDPTPGNNSGSDTTPVARNSFFSVTPCRLADTRNPDGPYGGPALDGLTARTFIAGGQCGIPPDAIALSFNLTVTQGTAGGDLRVYPAGVAAPLVSVINYAPGQVRANNGIVALGAAADFVVKSDQPSGTVQVILDVNGYFTLRTQAVVGYYDLDLNAGNSDQVGPIQVAGFKAIDIGDLSTADLSGIDILFVQNPENTFYSSVYTANLSKIFAFIQQGGILVFNDREVTDAASILPGSPGQLVRETTNDGANIDILDNTTAVTNGPGGVLNNSSLDGGVLSSHGYAVSNTLPPGAQRIFSRTDPQQIVLYSYGYGQGKVIYATIPLDFYLAGFGPPAVNTNMAIYAANVLAYANSLR